MYKLNQEKVKESGWEIDSIPAMQTVVFVMCGGGMLGRFAAHQPEDFYIDTRVGRLPYSRREIMQAVATLATLATLARTNGVDAKHLPPMPRFHNCGIF